MTIHVDIVSAEGSIYSGDADRVFVPGKMGELGIAPRHAPLLTTLRPGAIRVQAADGEKAFYITGGILEIQPHLVSVLADSALHAHELNESEALAARDRAREVLAGKHGDVDLQRAQQELIQAEARYHASQQLKGHRD